MEAMVDSASYVCNLAILELLNENSIDEIAGSWNAFSVATEELLMGAGDLSHASEFSSHVRNHCRSGLESLVVEQFFCSMKENFEKKGASRFWMHFDAYRDFKVMNIDDLKFITVMFTNFGSMALDRIHNTLKMFCIGDHPYDKSLQQLQSFLTGLVGDEKLELKDGMYFLKK